MERTRAESDTGPAIFVFLPFSTVSYRFDLPEAYRWWWSFGLTATWCQLTEWAWGASMGMCQRRFSQPEHRL